jgi:hypothetical protein
VRLTVSTAQISQIEVTFPAPNPPFGDILVPTSVPAGTFGLRSAVTLASPTAKRGVVQLHGDLDPKVVGKRAALKVYADPVTGTTPRAHTLVATRPLASGARRYHVQLHLATGKKWAIRVGYVNPGVVTVGRSQTRTLLA